MPTSKSPFAIRTFNRSLGGREGHSFKAARIRSVKRKRKSVGRRASLSSLLQIIGQGGDSSSSSSIAGQKDGQRGDSSVQMRLQQRPSDDGVFDLELDLDDEVVNDDDSDLESNSLKDGERDEASQWDNDEFEDDGSEFSKRIDDSIKKTKRDEKTNKRKKGRRVSYGDRPATTKGSTSQQNFMRADMNMSERCSNCA